MSRFYKILGVLFGLFLLSSAEARTDISFSFTSVPRVREVILPPQGYESCYVVPAAFYQGVWINAHRVCEYDNGPDGAIWVSGYWQCVRYRPGHRRCLEWAWIRNHWARPDVVEYGVTWGAEIGNGPDHYDHRYYHDHHIRGYESSTGPGYPDNGYHDHNGPVGYQGNRPAYIENGPQTVQGNPGGEAVYKSNGGR